MDKLLTWYCPNGCNVFDSDKYAIDDRPECANCGSLMTNDSSSFDNALDIIELNRIANLDKQ